MSRYVPAAAIVVGSGVAVWLATRSLQQDFAAYWVAGAARQAGLDPYVNHVGGAMAPELWDGAAVFAHSRFLYPPLVAELFRAFALLSYPVAKMVFTLLSVAAWVAASDWAARAAGAREARAVTFAAGALFYPLYLHLERGQLDLFLLLLLLGGFSSRAHPVRAGAALAAAAAFKPSLLALLPVVAALGRVRVAAAALGGLALVLLATIAISGAPLLQEYATTVVPRAALFGEGGDESMLLPTARLVGRADELQNGVARVGGRVYPQSLWAAHASASLSRVLAPTAPTKLATRGPALILFGGLVVAAWRVRRRRLNVASETLILWAAAIACVVASPAGWSMGLVWALPLAPWLARLRVQPVPVAWWALTLAGLACACPPPADAWAALAGTAVVVAAAALALTGATSTAERVGSS